MCAAGGAASCRDPFARDSALISGADCVGKQPPDSQVSVVQGEVPILVKSEGPLFEGGTDSADRVRQAGVAQRRVRGIETRGIKRLGEEGEKRQGG